MDDSQPDPRALPVEVVEILRRLDEEDPECVDLIKYWQAVADVRHILFFQDTPERRRWARRQKIVISALPKEDMEKVVRRGPDEHPELEPDVIWPQGGQYELLGIANVSSKRIRSSPGWIGTNASEGPFSGAQEGRHVSPFDAVTLLERAQKGIHDSEG